MANDYNFKPGIYRVKAFRVNVRGTPDTSNDSNLVGIQLTQGKAFPVFSLHVDKKGWTWGIITPKSAPQAHYVCIYNLNTLCRIAGSICRTFGQ